MQIINGIERKVFLAKIVKPCPTNTYILFDLIQALLRDYNGASQVMSSAALREYGASQVMSSAKLRPVRNIT